MKRTSLFLPIFVLSVLLLPLSCKKKQTEPTIDTTIVFTDKEPTHTWYYLTDSDIQEIDLPQNAPEVFEQPWTESVRIASMGCTTGNGQTAAPAYALVNRAGIIVFDDNKMTFHDDQLLFSDKTATHIVFLNDMPVFSLYRNSFFNEEDAKKNTNRPFLVQYKPDAQLFFPILTYDNLKLPASAEITRYIWDGTKLTVSIKENNTDRIVFSYLQISSSLPLLTLAPQTAQNSIKTKKISADQFRAIQETQPFQKAPEKLRTLLQTLPDTLGFYIDCAAAGGTTPTTYIHAGSQNSDSTISGKAWIGDTWTAAIFTDGTVYLSGALINRSTLLNGEAVSFRLPKLPAGYQYSDFAITGTTLYVSWEETSFYKTGRAGFIKIDLDALLYHNASLRTPNEATQS